MYKMPNLFCIVKLSRHHFSNVHFVDGVRIVFLNGLCYSSAQINVMQCQYNFVCTLYLWWFGLLFQTGVRIPEFKVCTSHVFECMYVFCLSENGNDVELKTR